VSVGELNRNLVLSDELIKVELPPSKTEKADISSVSPSSERIDEFWVVYGLYTEQGAMLLVETRLRE